MLNSIKRLIFSLKEPPEENLQSFPSTNEPFEAQDPPKSPSERNIDCNGKNSSLNPEYRPSCNQPALLSPLVNDTCPYNQEDIMNSFKPWFMDKDQLRLIDEINTKMIGAANGVKTPEPTSPIDASRFKKVVKSQTLKKRENQSQDVPIRTASGQKNKISQNENLENSKILIEGMKNNYGLEQNKNLSMTTVNCLDLQLSKELSPMPLPPSGNMQISNYIFGDLDGGGSSDQTQSPGWDPVILKALLSQGLVPEEVKSDGNCLFRAVAHKLDMNEDQHPKYRKIAMDFISRRRELLENFFETGDQNLEQYIERMSKDGSWGGHLEIYALCEALNLEVWIFTSELNRIIIRGKGDENSRVIKLFLDVKRQHYSSTQEVVSSENRDKLIYTKKGKLDRRVKANKIFLKNIETVKNKQKRKATSNLSDLMLQSVQDTQKEIIFNTQGFKRVKLTNLPEDSGINIQTSSQPRSPEKPYFPNTQEANDIQFEEPLIKLSGNENLKTEELYKARTGNEEDLTEGNQEQTITDP